MIRCVACREKFRLWPGDTLSSRKTNIEVLVVLGPLVKVTVSKGKVLCYGCGGKARRVRDLEDREVARTAASWAHEAVLRASKGYFVLPDLLEEAQRKVAYDEAHPELVCSACRKAVARLDGRDDQGRCSGCRPDQPGNFSGVAYSGTRRHGVSRRR